MYFHNTPIWFKWLYPALEWDRPVKGKKEVYLTFDDGPIPDVTPWVLEQLSLYQAVATFFCVGENIAKYPQIFNEIIKNGHQTGNHTFNHLNGWEHRNEAYFENIESAEKAMVCAGVANNNLFRPPYGKIKRSQISHLKSRYRLIMWGALSGDFDADLDPDLCLKHTIAATKPGTIVVFHDSVKSWERLKIALPGYLEFLKESGYTTGTL